MPVHVVLMWRVWAWGLKACISGLRGLGCLEWDKADKRRLAGFWGFRASGLVV